MFERIVAAIDKDPQRAAKVVETAAELALKFQSTVMVAHVREVEMTSAIAAGGRPGALAPSLPIESEEEAKAFVDEAVARLHGAGIVASGQIGHGSGSTARELLGIAQSYNANLIVVGDRDSRVSDVLLGGVAHKIVNLAACPVLLVR